MTERLVMIKNQAGIHARPAAILAQAANKFKSKIMIEKDSYTINAKSIMGIISLGAAYETSLKLIAEGEDEIEAVESLVKLFDSRFEEE